MTTKIFLTLLSFYNLMASPLSIIPAVRSQEVLEKYIVSGGPTSQLFSLCVEDTWSIEGTLYSISVSEDEEFVRFVPMEKMEFEWTVVDFGNMGIVGCAQKAYSLGVYMFKFDGSCKVAFNSSYDPQSEQGCDGTATEVVYIMSGPFNVVDGQVIPFGEYYGCQYSTPRGMRYGKYGYLVKEMQLPPLDTCCPTTDKGYCLVSEHVIQTNFCEAEALCQARGIPMASKSFYDDRAPEENGIYPGSFVTSTWVNLKRVDDQWLWIPGMEEFPSTEFDRITGSNPSCAILQMHENSRKTVLIAQDCNNVFDAVYCYDPNSTLPQC